MAPSTGGATITIGEWITILLFLLGIILTLVGLIYTNLARKMDEHAGSIRKMSYGIIQICKHLNIKLEDYNL